MSEFIEGEKSFPRTAKEIKQLVGKNIQYVLERNIDKSGRGYYFVDNGRVVESKGKNIWMDNGSVYFWREIRVYKVLDLGDENGE